MKIKRIKKLQVNSFWFDIKWDSTHNGGTINYKTLVIEIGTGNNDLETLGTLTHELMEICAIEMNIRFNRPDCNSDYLFNYDHRQFETMTNMFAGLLAQFLA